MLSDGGLPIFFKIRFCSLDFDGKSQDFSDLTLIGPGGGRNQDAAHSTACHSECDQAKGSSCNFS